MAQKATLKANRNLHVDTYMYVDIYVHLHIGEGIRADHRRPLGSIPALHILFRRLVVAIYQIP